MALMQQLKKIGTGYISLIVWIVTLVAVGAYIGNLTQSEIDTWYVTMAKSPLTPPNYIFGIVWTLLYMMLATCGWLLWANNTAHLTKPKRIYVVQMLCNWMWAPLFFMYHLIDVALMVIIAMICLTAYLIYILHRKIPVIAYLLLPYLCWISFAGYLNWYIWYYN